MSRVVTRTTFGVVVGALAVVAAVHAMPPPSLGFSTQTSASGTAQLGVQLFRTHCASCHGEAGRGNGPLASELRRKPPDLTQFAARNGGVFPSERLSRIIDGRDVSSHGDRDMPVWGDVFKRSSDDFTMDSVKARIEALVGYLRSIQQRTA